MASTFQELLAEAKRAIPEVSIDEVRRSIGLEPLPKLIDVREADELAAGRLPHALHVPRGFLESRIEALAERGDRLILYCAGGARSALAARTLQAMGYTQVSSMAGGFDRWHDRGFPIDKPATLGAEQRERYRRHLTLPEVGEEGQSKLLAARVLVMGAGGLGSPAALYLAAAGVGQLGIVDGDAVDLSNLQRQVIHTQQRLGMPKARSAEAAIRELNPEVRVTAFAERLDRRNALRILEGFDLVLDAGDNFPTRYLLNDACVMTGKPSVHGSIYRFEGQVTTFVPGQGPCYRCLYPSPPSAAAAPSCAEAGVLGVLPGVIGMLQATEILKLILGQGQSLVGRLLTYDALSATFSEMGFRRDPGCAVCSPGKAIELIDYEAFCGVG